MPLTEMSFTGAVMILVIVFIRLIAINKLPKKVFLILWEIVILKLLIPFSVPSVISVYTIFNNYEKQSTSYSNEIMANLPTEINSYEFISVTAAPEKVTISVWFVIWFIGTGICSLVFLFAYIICYKQFHHSEIVKDEFAAKWISEQAFKRPIKICMLDKISSPLTYGIFKPVILLPIDTDMENIEQLNYILIHEKVHIKRFDIIRKIVAATVLCVHWFNPVVWLMYIMYNRDIELFCDETVINSIGCEYRSSYAAAIIDMKERQNNFLSLYNHFVKNADEERITAVMKIKKMNFITISIACIVVICVTSVFATSAANTKSNKNNMIKVSDISSESVEAQLKAAGIDTNSKQYKIVISDIIETAEETGAMYTNTQAIKNRMSQYNSDGDYTAGGLVVPGMNATGIPESDRHQIISISEDARQKMFENCKREFISEYGIANGDTTKRSDVYRAFQLSIKKEDRLKGTWTLQQYETAYNQAFYDAVKSVEPNWETGKAFDTSILNNIKREDIDNALVKSGNELLLPRKSFDTGI